MDSNGMSATQKMMFGLPEETTNLSDKDKIRDDAPVPAERELLWPFELVKLLGPDLLERLYGMVPRRTKLTVQEVCRRERWQHSHVYNMIHEGSLDATDGRNPRADQPYFGIYRYSFIKLLFRREFIQNQTRGNLPPDDLRRCMAAAEALRKQERERKY